MNAKHTPGPWTVGREMNSERPGSVPVVALVRDSLAGRMHVAFVNGKAGEQEANARLIAAAPGLLAALRALTLDVQAWHEVHGRTGQYSSPQADYLAQAMIEARAAIAKATGGGA